MHQSKIAIAELRERTKDRMLNGIHGKANERKRQIYWTGFLSGLLASQRIEAGEPEALLAEANYFGKFFNDDDINDLIADLNAGCFSEEQDLVENLNLIIQYKREEIGLVDYYTETDDCNDFLGFCAGVICDGRVLPKEVKAIGERFARSPYLKHDAVYCDLHNALALAFADGVITDKECEEIAEWIVALVGDGYALTGLASQENLPHQGYNPITDGGDIKIDGACFVLTGPIKMGPRSFICSEIASCGGVTKKNISSSVDYLVVASTASPHWLTTHYGTKIKAARELIEKGASIKFLAEHALSSAIRVSKELNLSAKA